MRWKYEDMLHLPHHVSAKRPQMDMIDRAAQFAPFAALTGHDAVIRETARLVDQPIELTESRRAELDGQLQELAERLEAQPIVTITHYVPDQRKQGGAYICTTGRIKKVDAAAQAVVLVDGSGIELETITEIDVLP
ncbi:MAG: hypothetical protein IJW45_00020 [Oscillospiraceae bacterium]|nr:hypothetical protein [Oscillospiraceae bacterium]